MTQNQDTKTHPNKDSNAKTPLNRGVNKIINPNKDTKTYLAFIFGTEAAGGIIGRLTRDGMKAFQQLPQSPVTPPPIVFPIAWTLLYGLMGYGAARVYLSDCLTNNITNQCEKDRRIALKSFIIQLAVNLAWSIIFFNLQAFGLAFFWILFLWVLICYMYRAFKRVDRKAAYLQIPYLAWTTFAAYLTYVAWLLNA